MDVTIRNLGDIDISFASTPNLGGTGPPTPGIDASAYCQKLSKL